MRRRRPHSAAVPASPVPSIGLALALALALPFGRALAQQPGTDAPPGKGERDSKGSKPDPAKTKTDEPPKGKKGDKRAKKEKARDVLDPSIPLDDATAMRVFEQAQHRREEIVRLEKALDRRHARLAKIQKDLESRYRALRMVQEELKTAAQKPPVEDQPPTENEARLDKKRAEERRANVRRLAKVFNKMKPAEAGRVVPEMNERLVVAVLMQLKDRQAAKILGQIRPALAARISEKMAEVRKEKTDKKRKPKRPGRSR